MNIDNIQDSDLCSQRTPGFMPYLRKVDCEIAAFAGNTRGETISAVAARGISGVTGLSCQTSMDLFHVAGGAASFAWVAKKLDAPPEVRALSAVVGAVAGFYLRDVKR